jgi:general secretion pathway protein A
MGFIELTGDIGTGKTTICKALLNSLDKNTKTCFILNSDLSELQLLKAVTEDFGITVKNSKKITLLNELNNFLLKQLNNNNNVVLIIDEAQNLKSSVLEQIRLLSNLETEKEKLLQIILVGQPELKEKLLSKDLEQLRQRIAVRYHIDPLDETETKGYIIHRLNTAGAKNRDFFSDNAKKEIYSFSGGIPRLINILCDKSLLSGYVTGSWDIDEDTIKRCAKEIMGIFE